MEARVCPPPHLFSLPYRAHAFAENLGTDGPHTYFSVIRLLAVTLLIWQQQNPLVCKTIAYQFGASRVFTWQILGLTQPKPWQMWIGLPSGTRVIYYPGNFLLAH